MRTRRYSMLFAALSLSVAPLLVSGAIADELPANTAAVGSEIPAHFTPMTDSFDYVRREVMIPMRDGVHLKTVILVPKGAHDAPILLTRTPYDAVQRTSKNPSAHLSVIIGDGDVADALVLRDGYIRVLQDIRGKNGSEGDFIMNRPLIGPLNATKTDESTDTWDTIDWLVKNTPESNGRVGILGISYDGFTSLMALVHPHPALRASVPINAMVDGWRGDDWFHNGAFRTGTWGYVYEEESTRGSALRWWSSGYDDYADLMRSGSAGDFGKGHGLAQLGFFNKVTAHPAYDSFWSEQAMDKILAGQTLTVPTMLVHSLWDQEDIYGNIAVWNALKPHDGNGNLYLTIGPWFHHQERLDGSAIGAISFGSDTAAWWRDHVLKPFLDRNLKGDTSALALPTVTAFQSGSDRWERLSSWPACDIPGCHVSMVPLYLRSGFALGFGKPEDEDKIAYVSDPAKPVPFVPRPVHLSGDAGETTWQHWLVSDQRGVASRPDVLSFVTEPLGASVTVAGQPMADIVEKITGTDTDIVVKLIDVYPDEMGRDPGLGGYQLMVSADILRGRYREDFSRPERIKPGAALPYRFALPTVNHVFLPGHRIMVQIQSSWFPLYDRNPQSYVDNIFWAKPEDYKAQTVTVMTGGDHPSMVALPIVR